MVKMLMIVLLLHGVCVLLLAAPTVSAVSLSVSPNLQQVFRGSSSVYLSCVDDGQTADGWTVKRTRGGLTEDCGAAPGFGRLLGSYCVVDLSAPSETFWCEDSSGQQSDRVSFSVQSDTTAVILEIHALPVRTGSDVILRCRQRNGATVAAYFFIKGSSVGPKPEHIITNITQADEGLYSCSTEQGGKSPQSSLRVRDSPTIIHPPPPHCPPPPSTSTNFDPPLLLDKKVSLSVSPNLQQVFRGSSSVYLSCVDDGQTADGWTVKRTRGGLTEDCGAAAGFGRLLGSYCVVDLSAPSETFWCEDSSGQQSDRVSFSVQSDTTDEGVILEIPALPVRTGSDVILRCRQRNGATVKAYFFIKGSSVGPKPKHIITNITQADEGLYSCSTNQGGKSPQSSLRFRDPPTIIHPPPPHCPPPPSTSTNFDPPLLLDKKVSLSVSPNLQQFFRGSSSVDLSCVGDGETVDGWTVKRTRGGLTEDCGAAPGFGRLLGSYCVVELSAPSETFWCEDSSGQQSDRVSFSVQSDTTDEGLILEIPALPVRTRSDVILRCRQRNGATVAAYFSIKGSSVGHSLKREHIITNTTQADEGLYSCSTDQGGKSPQGSLRVRDPPTIIHPPPSASTNFDPPLLKKETV
ncbi:uncharacterized protein LOC134624394 isoform X2 [Pelmatolapia mariae]|uniref:uncharacterized protein LOC134624167 isoform X2 n=1 Tax=Pelmatolapia mariae TaxID=158779 RepID=UPI002FE55F9D